MARTIKWHDGVKAMTSKRNFNDELVIARESGCLYASKSNFTLLAKRAKLGTWKNAVTAIVKRGEVTGVLESLKNNNNVEVFKHELRRAADLV